MKIRHLVPYLVGLVVLAFALGSLPRGTAGGSLLFRSYWLLYLIYLGPIAILAIMIGLSVIIAVNWKMLGAGIGFGLANRLKMRPRKRSRYQLIVWMAFWALAAGVLILKQGTIFNPNPLPNATISQVVNNNTPPPNPFQAGVIPMISSLVQNSWFSIALLGLLAASTLVIFQSVRVAMKETGGSLYHELPERQLEGLQAVHDAIRLVEDTGNDPRTRIIACYQYMTATVSRLGAPVSSDQTARELESAIRSTFSLKGPATTDLTMLFEEARYSIHEMVDDDATIARKDLESIAQELQVQLKDWD